MQIRLREVAHLPEVLWSTSPAFLQGWSAQGHSRGAARHCKVTGPQRGISSRAPGGEAPWEQSVHARFVFVQRGTSQVLAGQLSPREGAYWFHNRGDGD